MKNILVKYLVLFTAILVTSCAGESRTTVQKTPEVNIVSSVSPSDGLDLKLVGGLFQNGNVKDAESLQKELNKPGGINNLDLDSDGKTDFINVSENTGTSNVKSFDLTTGADASLTHIATIEIEKGTDGKYNIHMAGSETVYGNNHTYRSSFSPSVSELLFYHWLFSPRPIYYHRPYYHGYYPAYYAPRPVVSRAVYTRRTSVQRTRVNKTVTRTKSYKPRTVSKNKGKASVKARKSIKNSKVANKKFKKQNSSGLKKGGFTKGKTTTKKSTPTRKATPKKRTTRSRTRSRSRSRGRR